MTDHTTLSTLAGSWMTRDAPGNKMALLVEPQRDDPIEGIIWPLPVWQKFRGIAAQGGQEFCDLGMMP